MGRQLKKIHFLSSVSLIIGNMTHQDFKLRVTLCPLCHSGNIFYSLYPSLLAVENISSFKLCVTLCPLSLSGDFFSSIIYQIYNSTIINRFTDCNCEEMMYFCMIFPKNYFSANEAYKHE